MKAFGKPSIPDDEVFEKPCLLSARALREKEIFELFKGEIIYFSNLKKK